MNDVFRLTIDLQKALRLNFTSDSWMNDGLIIDLMTYIVKFVCNL